jgi:hypothetical protein
MAPLPPALLLLAAFAWATPSSPEALAKAKEIRSCFKHNPFETGIITDADRSVKWNKACAEQADACQVLFNDAERAKVKDGYCLTCSPKPAPSDCPANTSCVGELVCKSPTPGPKVAVDKPSGAETTTVKLNAVAKAPPAPPCRKTAGCIARYVAANHYDKPDWSMDKDFKSEMYQAWLGARGARDRDDYSVCDAIPLRDAEHYLYHYWARLDSQVYNQFPLSFCAISYGYSFAKWTGVKKALFDDDNVRDSEPSMEEAHWGCQGLWDAYDKTVATGSCN